MDLKIAEISDWDILLNFYKKIYGIHHPLLNYEFWKWQYGNEEFGRAIIAIHNNEVVGHLGLAINSDYAWHINLFVMEDYRITTVLINMFAIAKNLGKQGNLSANREAVNLYRSLKWYQYADIERKLIINPVSISNSTEVLLQPIVLTQYQTIPEGNFWKQPALKSVLFEDGSTGIVQENIGGLRFVTIKDVKKATQQAFEMGFKWCDFVTSFNNPILRKLEKNNWKSENEVAIPWLLNPIVENSKSKITFLSKEPIDINFYINRTHSDIGRVGSINK